MSEPTKEIFVSYPGLIIAILFYIMYPLSLSFIWYNKFEGKIKHILVGAAGFFVSVLILERIILSILRYIFPNKIFVLIISLISPGLFEETARYVCFIILFKNPINRDKKTSISYGIGHGGIEAIYLALNLLLVLIAKDYLIKNGVSISDLPFLACIMGAIERFFAVIIHISLSVVVYKAVNEKKILFYIGAIFYHDLVDLFALLYQSEVINVYLLEIIVAFLSICAAFLAYKLYNTLDNSIDINSEEREKMVEENKENPDNLVNSATTENPDNQENPENP
jgi:uncharacterized membrane protein YhfC